MPLDGRDAARLTDMLHYATMAQKILAEHGPQAFEISEVARLALVRCIEVIGEAGHKVSPATQAALSAIPWHLMYGMRNRLIHDYGNTDYSVVIRVVREELPGLVQHITAFLAQHEPQA